MHMEENKGKVVDAVEIKETDKEEGKSINPLSEEIKNRAKKLMSSENNLLRHAGISSEELAYGYAYMTHTFLSETVQSFIPEDVDKNEHLKEQSKKYAELSSKINQAFMDEHMTQAESLLVLAALVHMKMENLVDTIFVKEQITEEDKQSLLENNPLLQLFK